MDRTPEELETEVREKRADVEQTIDALRAKMVEWILRLRKEPRR